jgi:hypothetical protein
MIFILTFISKHAFDFILGAHRWEQANSRLGKPINAETPVGHLMLTKLRAQDSSDLNNSSRSEGLSG